MSHRQQALGALEAVRIITRELDEAHDDRTKVNASTIARTSRDLQTTIRVAEVHALLAIAEAIGKATEPGPPRPSVVRL